MMTKFHYLKIIDDYYSGAMSDQEKERFEEELKSNDQLADEYREFINIMDAIHDEDLVDFHETVRSSFSEWQKNNHKLMQFIPNNSFTIVAAAVIIIAIIIGSIFIIDEKEHSVYDDRFAVDTIANTRDSIINNTFTDTEFQATDTTANKSIAESEELASASLDFNKEIYRISPVYKEILSTNLRSHNFQLISPADSCIFTKGDSIIINYKGNTTAVHLDILDRNGNIMNTLDDIKQGYSFRLDYPPGAYILRFRSDEEPLSWSIVFIS